MVVDLREEWGVVDDVDFMAMRQGDGYALASYSREMLWDGSIGNKIRFWRRKGSVVCHE